MAVILRSLVHFHQFSLRAQTGFAFSEASFINQCGHFLKISTKHTTQTEDGKLVLRRKVSGICWYPIRQIHNLVPRLRDQL